MTHSSYFVAAVVIMGVLFFGALTHLGERLSKRPVRNRSADEGHRPDIPVLHGADSGEERVENKKCPYCAEMIKAEAIRCRFCGSDLSQGNSILGPPKVAACLDCNVALVQTQVRKFASANGCLGALLFIIGIVCCLTIVGFIVGLVFMALGLIVSAVGGKNTVMVCPSCGRRGTTIAD